jgi:hypothetical protein
MHGVQLVCVMSPGRSGGPGGLIDGLSHQLDRDDRRTNERRAMATVSQGSGRTAARLFIEVRVSG